MKKVQLFAVLLTLLASVLIGSAVMADEPAEGRSGRAEVRFLEGMIDHHQMALDMANDCLAKAETDAVRTLCQNVITAQSREILTMRGWLLSWYGIDYEPVSMLHSDHQAGSPGGMMQGSMGMMGGDGMGMGMMGGDGMGMMSDMADMMSRMSEMMSNMSGMMGMMNGGMGMMGGEGMGMMDGGSDTMPNMPEMTMGPMLQALSMMNSLTVGKFLERAADLDGSTPLMEAFAQIAGGDSLPPFDMGMMGGMTQGQMMSMFGEMGRLTLDDVREMMGHLDDGENAMMMSLMQHHMEVMAGGADTAPAQGGDHDAHHPEGGATQGMPGQQHGSGQDHSQHSGAAGAFADPPMTMGMFAGLNALTGKPYEIAWLEAMIDHHDDALHMAARILERAPEDIGHESLRTLAERIISDQSTEIGAMEALIAELGG